MDFYTLMKTSADKEGIPFSEKEFEKFGGMLEKAQKNLQTASGQIEEVLGTRTRAIQRKLKEVETLNDQEARAILPEIGNLDED